MKVLVSGPLLSMSGYGNHARQVLSFVLEEYESDDVYCDIKSWGNTNWNLCKDFLSDNIFNKIINNFISETDLNEIKQKSPGYFDLAYHVCFPSEWDSSFSRKNIGVFAGIESTICCEQWLDRISQVSSVIVPSFHALNSIERAKKHFLVKDIKTPIHVIPEWFYVELEKEANRNTHILKEVKTENNLLIIGQINNIRPECDRKNILQTIETCIEALSEAKRDNFGLVLKLFCENNSLNDFLKTKKIIATYIDLLKNKFEHMPKIYMLHGNLTPGELCDVYKSPKISCLVSGTRGEGFGLPFLEAAAAGLPIVATKWSAHDEFLDFYLGVDYDLVDVPSSLNRHNSQVHEYSNIWVTESKWAEFDKKDMKNNINKIIMTDRFVSDNEDKLIAQQKTILNKYSKNAIMSIYKQQLGR